MILTSPMDKQVFSKPFSFAVIWHWPLSSDILGKYLMKIANDVDEMPPLRVRQGSIQSEADDHRRCDLMVVDNIGGIIRTESRKFILSSIDSSHRIDGCSYSSFLFFYDVLLELAKLRIRAWRRRSSLICTEVTGERPC